MTIRFRFIAALLVVIVAWVMCGCSQSPSATIMDQCMRNQAFERCLATVPRGPDNTKYNDWAEVVSECAEAAMYQSYRLRAQVKMECRDE